MAKFKPGDKVVANETANDLYRYTKKGWRGTVVGNVIVVCDDEGEMHYEVVDNAFDLVEDEKEAE